MEKNDSYSRLQENKKLKSLFLIIFTLIIVSLIVIFRYYFWPFLFAVILYMALRPFHEKLVLFVRSRTLSSVIVIVILFLLILFPLFYLFITLADETYQLYLQVQTEIHSGSLYYIKKIEIINEFLDYFNIGVEDIISRLSEIIEKTSVAAFTSITKIISFPISFSINYFFMILMLFFLFKDGYKLDRSVYKTLPFPDDIEKNVINRLKEVIKVLLAGNLFVMLLQGFTLGLGFYISGISMPILWGSVGAILSLIPVVGTTLIWLPAVIYLLLTASYGMAIFLGTWSMSWYLLLENLLKPKLFGRKLNFHPLVFFFLLLGSIQAFSLPGVIIGPLLLTLFYSFWEIYKVFDEYNMWGGK